MFEVDVKPTKCCVEGKSQAACSRWGRAHFRGHAASAVRGWEHKRKVRIVAAKDPGHVLERQGPQCVPVLDKVTSAG